MVTFLILGVMALGIFTGYYLGMLTVKDEYAGTIRVDRSDPESGPYLFIELEPDGMKKLHEMKTVRLHVNLESYIPRK